jgi:hypothetical protein
MAKRRVGSQTITLIPDQKKLGINPIHLSVDGVWHTLERPDLLICRRHATYFGKLSTRAITLLQTASRSEVFSQSYGAPKSRESQLGRFRDSHSGVLGQKAIWMWAPWRGAEYTIRGKGWLPTSLGCGESCVSVLPVARPCTKSAPTTH